MPGVRPLGLLLLQLPDLLSQVVEVPPHVSAEGRLSWLDATSLDPSKQGRPVDTQGSRSGARRHELSRLISHIHIVPHLEATREQPGPGQRLQRSQRCPTVCRATFATIGVGMYVWEQSEIVKTHRLKVAMVWALLGVGRCGRLPGPP